MEAVRCEDAANAAADGSRLELSDRVRVSWYDVGDGFLGPLLRKRRFVENLRDSPPLLSDIEVGSSGVGRGCDRSLAAFTNGRISSLNFLFSSEIRRSSSFSCRSSASRSLMMRIILAKSSWVGPDSAASVSAAVQMLAPKVLCCEARHIAHSGR